jgi:hypothetical protein
MTGKIKKCTNGAFRFDSTNQDEPLRLYSDQNSFVAIDATVSPIDRRSKNAESPRS